MSGSNQTWKTIILAIALAAIVAWAAALPQVVEIARTQQTYGLGIAGSHDVQETGSRAIVIDALVPDGPLALAGVAVGDRISLEPDEIRLFVGNPQDSDGIRAGQEVGIVVDRAGETRHLKVTPALLPYRADFLFVNTSFFALSPIVLVFGLLVGFRQPNGIAYRALALSFLARGLSAALGDPTYLPPGVPGAVSSASVILGPASYLFMILFALSYHGAEPFGLRRRIVRFVFPILVAANLVSGIATMFVWSGAWLPWRDVVDPIIDVADVAAIVVGFGEGWVRSEGGLRERFKWLTVALALLYGLPVVLVFDWNVHGIRVGALVAPAAQVLGVVVLAYAVLRHRVFDLAFAVNRAAVYTVTTGLLLISFGLLEWAAEHLLRFEGREQSMALDAGLALGIFLAFHRVRDWVEAWIERLLFHAWHIRDADLRKFLRRAAHVTTEAALLEAIPPAVDRYSDGTGSAVYLLLSDGTYRRVASTLSDAPATLDADAPGVVGLRESRAPLLSDDTPLFAGADLALPMSHRAELSGLIALGPKVSGTPYRPDELELLGHAAHELALDLHALKILNLMMENDRQGRQIAELKSEVRAFQTAFESLPGKAVADRPVAGKVS